jgi:sulfur-oxidizing protein SoxX
LKYNQFLLVFRVALLRWRPPAPVLARAFVRSAAEFVVLTSAVVAGLGVAMLPLPAGAEEVSASVVAQGKAIAFDRSKGHCLACHAIEGGQLPGNVGPALIAIKMRYPDKSKLRALIYDARIINPNTIMPPFGRNNLLADDEIDKVVEFVLSL